VSPSKRDDPLAELIGEFADRLRGDHWQPEIDVFETERAVVVRVELAGVQSQDLRVTVDGDEIRISGSRRAPEPGDLFRLHRMEIASGPFQRRVRVPIPFDREAVTAHLAEGFLTVTLPRRAPARVRVPPEPGQSGLR
jgi:HSP20 family molecular chaperone IbpA